MADGAGSSYRWRGPWPWLVLVTLLVLAAGCLLSLPVAAGGEREKYLPISLRAQGEADYSVDPLGTQRAPLQLALIGDVLRDLDPGAADVDRRVAAVMEELRTPVATSEEPEATSTSSDGAQGHTSTPAATETASPVSTTTGSPSPSVTAGTVTETAAAPTATSTSTAPGSPTATPISPTLTATDPGATPIPSDTPNPSTPTNTPPATATDTPVTPTATATAVPPSNTPVPPTATPTENVCDSLSMSNFDREGHEASWEIHNESSSDVTVKSIFLHWPFWNDELLEVELDGDMIWDQGDDDTPTLINSDWKGGSGRRTVEAGSTESLVFRFEDEARIGFYSHWVSFTNDCTISD